MAAPVYSYRPEVKIEIADNDVTINLGDKGSVTIRKNLYAPAGEFQITFPDMPVEATISGGDRDGQQFRDSLYGLINPMDKIVIHVRRWRDGQESIDPWVPVLTGFVRSVGRDEEVGRDGRVKRQVVVAGHDCGAVFLMEQVSAFITFQNNGSLVTNIPALAWLYEYDLSPYTQPVQDFIWDVATTATKPIMQTAGFEFQKQFLVQKGTVVPHTAFSQEGTIWELLYRYADGPWNELFVRENRNMMWAPDATEGGDLINPELVFRPTPWMDINDNPLPDAVMDMMKTWDIKMAHVVALRAHRDDAELVNHVWIHTPQLQWASMAQGLQQLGGLVNGDTREKFGDRIQQQATRLLPLTVAPMSLPMEEQASAEASNITWVEERRDWMVKAQTDVHEFERGSITLKGYPMMRVGDYFRLLRGDIEWTGYITNIVHDFRPYQHYLTTMDYIRGTQILRRRELQAPWDQERKQNG